MDTQTQGPLWTHDSLMSALMARYAKDSKAIVFYGAIVPFILEITSGYDARINQLHKAVGTYAINATSDGWRIATLENELTLIREKLKDQPPVYDHLDRWLYGEQEQTDEQTD